jgi:hypothetical protein
MRAIKSAISTLGFLLFAPQVAVAGQMTTADLLLLCRGPDRYACELYVLGVAEGAALAAHVIDDRAHFCIPDEATATKLTEMVEDIATRDLEKAPDDARAPAVSMIAAILLRRYPCGKDARPH